MGSAAAKQVAAGLAAAGSNTMPPSTGAPACALTKWPSAASALLWHACTPPAEAPASLDAQLALIRPKLSRDESYKLGKLSRSTLHLLFDELRYASGSASLEASWDVLSCALRYAYGQRREDLFLLPLLLNALRSEPTGRAQTFVELGALDGMSMSNTYMLERCFSWRGLLVEANPANYAKLAASPRNVTKRHAAVCAGDGSAGATVRMSIAGDNYAAMADLVDTKRKRHVGDGVVEVGCRSLTQLMREAGLHHGATFLSLDVSRNEPRTARASHASATSLEIYCVTRPRRTCEANGPANKRNPAPAKRGPHAICVSWRSQLRAATCNARSHRRNPPCRRWRAQRRLCWRTSIPPASASSWPRRARNTRKATRESSSSCARAGCTFSAGSWTAWCGCESNMHGGISRAGSLSVH